MWTKILNSLLYMFVVVFTSCKPFKKNELNLQIDNVGYIEITKKEKSIYKTKDKDTIQKIINKMNYAKPVLLKSVYPYSLVIYTLDNEVIFKGNCRNSHFIAGGEIYETDGDFFPAEK